MSTSSQRYDVAMIGLGYIGLPTAAVIARSGLRVCGVDINRTTVDTVNAGRIHTEEKDLDALVRDVVERGLLSASTEAPEADTFLIAVPTPLAQGNRPDISHVLSAVELIAPRLRSGNCVILESTSPIGTTEKVAAMLAELRPDLCIPGHCQGDHDVHIAYCPERVLPGQIIAELVSNDRVIGGLTPSCSERAGAFYRGFVEGACLPTSAGAAEMVKLSENSFRDVNIAFANELSMIAEDNGIDVWDVIRLANRHPRVNILQPGPGVGGHCIAVDPWFLAAGSPDLSPLIRTARQVNDAKATHVAEHLVSLLEAHPDKRLAILGLTFKPNIDDIRESPALEIAEHVAAKFGHRTLVVEPYLDALPQSLARGEAKLVSLEEAVEKAGLIAVLVDHKPFRDAPRSIGEGKIVYDTRGMWA